MADLRRQATDYEVLFRLHHYDTPAIAMRVLALPRFEPCR